jgi:hypothetical protein
MDGFNFPANIEFDIVQSLLVYTSFFGFGFALCVFYDMQDLYSQFSSQNSILFSYAQFFFLLGKSHSFIWGPYVADHGMVLI